MASPLQTGKQSVKLGAPVRGSRIRRDPPPIAKKIAERDPEERDQTVVVVGVIAFALAIFVIVLAAGSYYGSSAREYTLNMDL
jgi:hypothetical protein